MNNDFEFDSMIKKMAAEHQPELPSPGVIWWRAQILRKQAEKERIERPYRIMRTVAAMVCVLVLVGLWASNKASFGTIVESLGVLPFVIGAAIGVLLIGLALQAANAKSSS